MSAEELASIRKQLVERLYECTDYVLKYLDGDEKKSELNKLKSYIEGYCSLDNLITSKDSESLICEDDSFDDISKKVAEWRPNSRNNNHDFMTAFLNKIKTNEDISSQNDPELVITSTYQIPIDPITQGLIQKPVKNLICGHVYDERTILAYMNMNSRAKCPSALCRSLVPLTKKNLVPHGMPTEMNLTPASNQNVFTPVQVPIVDDDENTMEI